MHTRIPTKFLACVCLFCATSPAFAHPGHGEELGLLGGLIHPFTGFDHLLAMLFVGAWASRLQIRRSWLAPAAFIVAMVAGFATARVGVRLPAEPIIALSLVGLPVLVASARRLSFPVQFTIVTLFGAAHGFAHGTEIEGPAIPFFAGMVIATAILHGLGFFGTTMLRIRLPART